MKSKQGNAEIDRLLETENWLDHEVLESTYGTGALTQTKYWLEFNYILLNSA